MKRLISQLHEIIPILLALCLAVAWLMEDCVSLPAFVATKQGVWLVDGEEAPALSWEWEYEQHMLIPKDSGGVLIDGKAARYIAGALTNWGVMRTFTPPDQDLGSDGVVVSKLHPIGRMMCIQSTHATPVDISGYDTPIRANEIVVRDYEKISMLYLPIWSEARPYIWADDMWLYAVAPLEGELRVVATRLDGDRTVHVVSDALPCQVEDDSLQDHNGRPCVLRWRDDGSLQRWSLQQIERESERKYNTFTWVEQPTLTVAEHPSLARPYKLDLSQGRRELLYLDEAGHLCITDLDPDAKPVVLDDSLTLTEADLDRIERYGNAITFPLPDGSTRVWFPRSNVFGMTRWLTWDLP